MVGDISTDTLERVEQSSTSNLLTEPPEVYEMDKAVDSPKNQKCNGKDDTSRKYIKYAGRSLHEALHNFKVSVFNVTRVQLECEKFIALFKKGYRQSMGMT